MYFVDCPFCGTRASNWIPAFWTSVLPDVSVSSPCGSRKFHPCQVSAEPTRFAGKAFIHGSPTVAPIFRR
jgi:hypothetical protein